MLSVAHGLTGAYLASLVPTQPLIYIPTAIAFHFLEDAVPHWDFGTGMTSGKKSKVIAYGLEIFDLTLTVILIVLLWQKTPVNNFIASSSPVGFFTQLNWPIWIGAFAGIIVDLLEFPNAALGIKLPFLKPLHDLHHKMHRSTPNAILGLLPQLLVILAIVYLVLT